MDIFDVLIYVVAVVLSFYYRDKLSGSVLKYLPYFLLFDISLDLFSIVLARVFKTYNVWVINILFNFELLFIFFLYYHLLKNEKYKKFTLIAGIIYESIFIVKYIFTNNWLIDFQEFSFFIGTLLAIIVLMLFILDMLASNDFLYIHQYTVFWITVAYLFYLVIPFPLSFWIHLFYRYGSDYLLEIALVVQTLANLLFFSTLIFGFIWSKKRYK